MAEEAAADLVAVLVRAQLEADTLAEAADFILPDHERVVAQPIFIVEERILPGRA